VLVERDPATKVAQARAHIGRQEWKQAAECYGAGFVLEPTDNGELWFEYAACQLLAGDQAAHRQSCAHMLARYQATPNMRVFLVARACTLASGSTADPAALRRLSAPLLRSTDFAALTELGALQVRTESFPAAVTLLERSLLADGRPGRAVLNWLWLALVYQKMGNPDEARRWLYKAKGWLDQQEGRMPRESSEMGSHLHNWLEAHVLRREAETLLR
jgi:tetratricopeptide (TPR) repeat protein